MKRSKFLSLAGLSFLGTVFLSNANNTRAEHNACNDPITPSVPEGPYYKDEHLNRIDITENKKDIP